MHISPWSNAAVIRELFTCLDGCEGARLRRINRQWLAVYTRMHTTQQAVLWERLIYSRRREGDNAVDVTFTLLPIKGEMRFAPLQGAYFFTPLSSFTTGATHRISLLASQQLNGSPELTIAPVQTLPKGGELFSDSICGTHLAVCSKQENGYQVDIVDGLRDSSLFSYKLAERPSSNLAQSPRFAAIACGSQIILFDKTVKKAIPQASLTLQEKSIITTFLELVERDSEVVVYFLYFLADLTEQARYAGFCSFNAEGELVEKVMHQSFPVIRIWKIGKKEEVICSPSMDNLHLLDLRTILLSKKRLRDLGKCLTRASSWRIFDSKILVTCLPLNRFLFKLQLFEWHPTGLAERFNEILSCINDKVQALAFCSHFLAVGWLSGRIALYSLYHRERSCYFQLPRASHHAISDLHDLQFVEQTLLASQADGSLYRIDPPSMEREEVYSSGCNK